MALTQIRDIAFVATEPQNKYNLWLHFKEKRVLVLEMWINGQWTEITNGSINVPFAPDPQPEPPTPTPTHDYPQFNFEDNENNLQVISEIDSTYTTVNLNGEYGSPRPFVYDILGTYNSITNTITIIRNNEIVIFTVDSITGEITLTSTYNLSTINDIVSEITNPDFSETDTESLGYIRNNPIVTIQLNYIGDDIYEDNRGEETIISTVQKGDFPISAKRYMRTPDAVVINGNQMQEVSIYNIMEEIIRYVNTKSIIVIELKKILINQGITPTENVYITRYIIDYNNYIDNTIELDNSNLNILFKRLNSRKKKNTLTFTDETISFVDGIDFSEYTSYDLIRYNSYLELENEWLQFTLETEADSSDNLIRNYNLYTLIANLNEPIVYTPKVTVGEISNNSVSCTIESFVEPYIKDIYKNIRFYYKASDVEIENWQPNISGISPDSFIKINMPGNIKETVDIELSQEVGTHTKYFYCAVVIWIDRIPGGYIAGTVYNYMSKIIAEQTEITYTNE